MSDFWRAWLHNLWVTLAIIVGVALFMLIFMRIFYSDSISATLFILQAGAMMISALNLWPIVVLAIIVGLFSSALPRRRRDD